MDMYAIWQQSNTSCTNKILLDLRWRYIPYCNSYLIVSNTQGCCIGRLIYSIQWCLNTLTPRQHGRHFAGDILNFIFSYWKICILIKTLLTFAVSWGFNWQWVGISEIWAPNSRHCLKQLYRQVSNIRRTWVGNEIVDHSHVVGASPVGAAPTLILESLR